MTSRDEILTAIRRRLPEASPLPDLTGPWIQYSDVISQFGSVLEQIGGRCIHVDRLDAMASKLAELPEFNSAKRVVSTIDGIVTTAMDLTAIDLNGVDDPHSLHDIDFAILQGQFAVAENAAVWIDDKDLKHRVIYFLCQHLAFVVRTSDVVHNMHEAYERLTFSNSGFGGFIAGPSKTADIEQSLVIGAHGPKSLTVFLVDSLES